MLNTTVQAAAEGLPKISRRSILGGLASIPATVTAAQGFVAPEISDPLLEAIEAYRAAIALYDREAPDDSEADAFAEATYCKPLEAIVMWDQPAVTRKGAVEALRFVQDEMRDFSGSRAARPVLAAALAYFDGEVQS